MPFNPRNRNEFECWYAMRESAYAADIYLLDLEVARAIRSTTGMHMRFEDWRSLVRGRVYEICQRHLNLEGNWGSELGFTYELTISGPEQRPYVYFRLIPDNYSWAATLEKAKEIFGGIEET